MSVVVPLTSLPGVGPRTAERLASLGVRSASDLPFLLPRAWQDRRHPLPFRELVPGAIATARGQVLSLAERRNRARGTLEAVLSDGRSTLVLKWFRHSQWLRDRLAKEFPPGTEVLATGRVELFAGRLEMHHPDLSSSSPGTGDDEEGGGIIPLYPLTAGLTQKTLRRAMRGALEQGLFDADDGIPPQVLGGLPTLGEALRALHFPPPDADAVALAAGKTPWHERLRYGELLLFQLAVLSRRKQWRERLATALGKGGALAGRLERSLPFPLTAAQQRVLGEIRGDLSRPHPMFRLLQGDVGSGKTVVALLAMAEAVEAGAQAALLAPTEILAEQHLASARRFLAPLGIETVFLSGRQGTREREEALSALASGRARAAVGTHALLTGEVAFANLGLAVVDEQHRFGVLQRLSLRRKGPSPHFLLMSATPIPRSLAMVLYGDMDHSLLDEMPPGREPVDTVVWGEGERGKLYLRIAAEVKAGRQVYAVYPLVEETERSELAAAREMAAHLQKHVFPNLSIGLLTGRMKPEEKERAMGSFRAGEHQVLVATTVIEVGVDVPNATLMVVEHAERFGLFQLHQLRGRVGRGEHPGRCVLMAGRGLTEEAKKRLGVMTRTTSGFAIAEADLAIRGPGDFLGTRQAGWPDLRFAHPLRDRELLSRARKEAIRLLSAGELDPRLRGAVESFAGQRLALSESG